MNLAFRGVDPYIEGMAEQDRWDRERETGVSFPAVDVASPPAWLDLLVGRIDALRIIAGEDDLPFDESSAADAVSFAARLPHAARPSAFLIGNGNIRLLWETADGEQVGLQFRGNDAVQYVLFKGRPSGIVTTMGSDFRDDVLDVVTRLGLIHVLNP